LSSGDGGDSQKAAAPLVSEIVIDRDGRLFVSNLSAEVLEALARAVGEDPSFAAQYQALRRYLEQKEKGHAP